MGAAFPSTSIRPSKKSALEVIFTVLHAGGKFDHDNYKTAGGLHGVGASVVNALSKELIATVRRDGAEWEQRFKQGKPLGPPKKIGPARGSGTKVFFHPDPGDLSEDRARGGDHPRAARSGQLPAQGAEDQLRGREREDEGDVRAQRRAARVPQEDRRRARRQAGARRGVLAREAERHARRPRAAMDRSDRRAHSQLRQRHSDRVGRHARKRDARRPGQGGAQLHRYAQPVAEGRDADGRRHPRGADRRAQRVRVRSRSFRGRPRIDSTTRKCCRRSIRSCGRRSSTG